MNQLTRINLAAPALRYDAMCAAIPAACAVDEAKYIRDKAVAIQVNARQAKNIEAERQAARSDCERTGRSTSCWRSAKKRNLDLRPEFRYRK